MKKRRILIVAAVAALLLIGFGVWSKWLSTTRIAFVNYQTITLGQIARANDNPLVKIENLTAEDLAKADGYDMVFVQAMGFFFGHGSGNYISRELGARRHENAIKAERPW